MNVLFVPFNYQNPFQPIAALFFHDQAQALVKAGVKVVILSVIAMPLTAVLRKRGAGLGLRIWRDHGVDVYQYVFPAVPKARRINQWLRLRLQQRLYQVLRQQHGVPDVTHVQMFPGGDFAQWLRKTHGVPYVVTEHLSGFSQGVYTAWQLHNARTCYQSANGRIAVSKHLAATLADVSGQSFQVIPNCVDTSLFQPAWATAAQPPKPAPLKRLIHVGRLHPIKQQGMLIRAFARAEIAADVTLTIVGAGEVEQQLRTLIAELGLESRITLCGAGSKQRVIALLAEHDLFVLSSKYETFGVVLIEAMSMGLPVLSTDCLGAREIITNPDLGSICENSEQALADAIGSILLRPFDPAQIRNFAIKQFSNQAVATKITSVYSQITSKTSTATAE